VPALLVVRNRNSTSRRDQYRKVGLQEAIPRLASIVDELRANRKLTGAKPDLSLPIGMSQSGFLPGSRVRGTYRVEVHPGRVRRPSLLKNH
jgi:hypothetical protein